MSQQLEHTQSEQEPKQEPKEEWGVQFGEKRFELLLTQYNAYVEMADRQSQRRITMNSFFISVITGILVLIGYALKNSLWNNVILAAVGFLVFIISLNWYYMINSYKQLSAAKFTVIHEMESRLPFPQYFKEQEILDNYIKYKAATLLEIWIPIICMIMSVIITFVGIFNLIFKPI